MTPIILSTLNARFIHSALGLRYLYANLQDLQKHASIFEFTIDSRPIDIAEKLLKLQPRIIGFGVYIWNIEQTTYVVALLKKLSPDTVLKVLETADRTLAGKTAPAHGLTLMEVFYPER